MSVARSCKVDVMNPLGAMDALHIINLAFLKAT